MNNHEVGPRIDRLVQLAFQGDWGQGTLHAICGWLGQGVLDHTAKGSRFAIWSGHGFLDNLRAVDQRDVDVALVTPAASVRMAQRGLGPFASQPATQLRAIATLPQWDHLALAISADFHVHTFEDLRTVRPPLRIATGPNDDINTVGFAVRRIMDASGIDEDVFASWGGQYLTAERPGHAVGLLADGTANAVFHEAVFADYWQRAVDQVRPVFIPLERAALRSMERDFGWPAGSLPAGFFPTLDEAVTTLDFSDFVIVVRADLPDDIAHLLAWWACERRELLEQRYRHIPANRSPLTYPLDPTRMGETPIPLHNGALRYFHEALAHKEAAQ